ncbi:hypothetical protein J2W32_003832 [Variovorax boronicumulans]|uniref:Uncharacterized protein n=1 Tax=Variovorax boronicumulans TaxID=436515 RepID=A0AAW8D0A3_9BURK|nr:hypothetical protein [Variovorax boronicumulans]MDP9894906.1 hypothetical protein [Variovorax boronicumulans]MDQ0054774.1 hypothetical protein [Variovorax boronicumulans]
MPLSSKAPGAKDTYEDDYTNHCKLNGPMNVSRRLDFARNAAMLDLLGGCVHY